MNGSLYQLHNSSPWIAALHSYVLVFNRTNSTNLSRPANKIRNSNIEIRNKPKDSNPNYEIQNRLVWSFLIFYRLKLFRISDFEFATLFILGVLCAFARVMFCLVP